MCSAVICLYCNVFVVHCSRPLFFKVVIFILKSVAYGSYLTISSLQPLYKTLRASHFLNAMTSLAKQPIGQHGEHEFVGRIRMCVCLCACTKEILWRLLLLYTLYLNRPSVVWSHTWTIWIFKTAFFCVRTTLTTINSTRLGANLKSHVSIRKSNA